MTPFKEESQHIVLELLYNRRHKGKNMEKGASCAKVKVLSKDYIFHVVVFY
jgi:hypothetical protein